MRPFDAVTGLTNHGSRPPPPPSQMIFQLRNGAESAQWTASTLAEKTGLEEREVQAILDHFNHVPQTEVVTNLLV